MKNFIKRVRRAPWTFKQPLTAVPEDKKTKISDLFVWRNSDDWKSSFELLNIAYLFGECGIFQVDIVFFDAEGSVFFEKTIELFNGDRQTLNISKILEDNFKAGVVGEFGTFAVFHRNTPDTVVKFNSFVAERGYVSYCYRGSLLSSYVHGNLDSIGKIDQNYVLLGGTSLLKRDYNLQYQLFPGCEYDIALTNPRSKPQKVTIKTFSFNDGRIIEVFYSKINSRAAIMYALKGISQPCRISIESRMIMARPIIFINKGDNMDVFHG